MSEHMAKVRALLSVKRAGLGEKDRIKALASLDRAEVEIRTDERARVLAEVERFNAAGAAIATALKERK